MNRTIIFALWFLSIFFASHASIHAAITIETVPIGNIGNVDDPNDSDQLMSGMQSSGGVSYNYNLGKYEVTIGQYTIFLNSIAKADPYNVFNSFMATNTTIAGIARSGSSGNYSYSTIGSPNHPIAYVGWGDAARFANWMHNGQPVGTQNSSTTEAGAYTLNGAISNADLASVVRNPGARWFIPSENEWYKAAYYQPANQGGDMDDYWTYPTLSNNIPNSDHPSGDPSIQTNIANFRRNDNITNGYNDGYAVTGVNTIVNNQNYLTDVGAYTFAPGPYGTFDQGGNLSEWTEGLANNSQRFIRGGSWAFKHAELMANVRFDVSAGIQGNANYIGFRLASIPEPSSIAFLTCAATGIIILTLRRR